MFQIFCIMLREAICRFGSKGNVLQHQNLFFSFLHFLFSSVPPAFPAFPSPLSFPLSVLSLSLISDPFFMHYSITLNSHLQCITSSRLSQTHFVLLSLSFSHFASLLPSLTLLQCIMTGSSLSPLQTLYYLFVSSLVTSSHANISFPLIFTSHLPFPSIYITLSVCTAAVLPFNWLFKALFKIISKCLNVSKCFPCSFTT